MRCSACVGPADGFRNEFLSNHFCFVAGSEKHFVNLGSKNFKRRYCYLKQEVDGTYILVLYKDERKVDAKITIVMDFCVDVLKVERAIWCWLEARLKLSIFSEPEKGQILLRAEDDARSQILFAGRRIRAGFQGLAR